MVVHWNEVTIIHSVMKYKVRSYKVFSCSLQSLKATWSFKSWWDNSWPEGKEGKQQRCHSKIMSCYFYHHFHYSTTSQHILEKSSFTRAVKRFLLHLHHTCLSSFSDQKSFYLIKINNFDIQNTDKLVGSF